MSYSQKLRGLFPEISPHWEDLLMLEAFQVRSLPDRVAAKEFATLLHTYPLLYRFLVSKHPPISTFLDRILEENRVEGKEEMIKEACQEALWEIADLIIYNKHPELFDTKAPIRWDIKEIITITPLEGKIVADVGAGSGRIAFLVAPVAQTVFAVEPIGSFRSFVKEKAVKKGVNNLFVSDGTLNSIPLPDHSLDILITSNAIGWNLQGELEEIERVVRPGGHAIHLLWSHEKQENPFHETLISVPWSYSCLGNMDSTPQKLKYTKCLK